MIRYRYVGVLVIFLAVLAGSSLVAAQVFSLQHSAGWNWEKAGFDDENSGLNPQMQINKGDVKDLDPIHRLASQYIRDKDQTLGNEWDSLYCYSLQQSDSTECKNRE